MARQGASRGWLADAATNRRKCEANGPRATADLSDVSGVVTMEAPGAPPRRHCHAETAHDTCSRRGATWRSGDAADCKSAHPGSIPGVASLKSPNIREKCRDKNAERVTNAERAGTKMGTREKCRFAVHSGLYNLGIGAFGELLLKVVHEQESVVLLCDLDAGVTQPL